jgi:hypothetical protein
MAIDITGFQRMRREQAERKETSPAWEDMTYNELKAAAKEAGIQGYTKMSKDQLIEALKSR